MQHSQSKLLEFQRKNTNDESALSYMDQYDLRAYQFHQYFPQPEPGKTEQEILEEKRMELGLNKQQTQRRTSV